MGLKVVVVGAGMGGLAACALLAARGADVTLVERAQTPGGKLRRVEVAGRPIDVGPTVLTLPSVFQALFAECGAALDKALTLERADILARHYWPDGTRLDLHADEARSVDAVGRFAGAEEAKAYSQFMAQARDTYEILDQAFMRDASPSLPGLMLKVGPQRLSRIDPYQTYWKALEQRFVDPRLRQLFGRYATYVGSSPFEAPATLMLIAHVEAAGVWRVREGLHALPTALAELAKARGAVLRYGCEVEAIHVERGRSRGVRLAGGEVIEADAVVHDGDSGVLGSGRLGREAARAAPAIPPAERSFSALTFAMSARASGSPLAYHTVVFSPDYPAEFQALARGEMPSDPSLYLCAQDRGGGEGASAGAPQGAERLFAILNAPARGDEGRPDPAEVERCETRMRSNLARAGIELGEGVSQPIGPVEFERLGPGTGGALYGRAGHGWMAAFKRPTARSRVPGLYLAGGSVHPGPGLPMAALSGRMAADCVMADARSLVRRRG